MKQPKKDIFGLCLLVFFSLTHFVFSDCILVDTNYDVTCKLFDKDNQPESFPLKYNCIILDRQEREDGSIVFTFASTNTPSAPIIQMGISNGLFISILNEARQVINKSKRPVKVADDYTGSGIVNGDLNNDGKEDYVLDLWIGGCGLASGFCNLVFILSVPQENTYAITTVTSLFPDDGDFVDLNNDGKCEFILCDFLSDNVTDLGADYFIYQVLSVDEAQVKLANEMDERFPAFFPYIRDSKQIIKPLSEEEKRRMLEKCSNPFWESR